MDDREKPLCFSKGGVAIGDEIFNMLDGGTG